jgi:hypothetical protein
MEAAGCSHYRGGGRRFVIPPVLNLMSRGIRFRGAPVPSFVRIRCQRLSRFDFFAGERRDQQRDRLEPDPNRAQ